MNKSKKIRVAVNGYGVIGKRVVDAVSLQPDMELIGVSDIGSDYRVQTAVSLEIPVFAPSPENASEMSSAGIPITGSLNDLLSQTDIIADCTPKGIVAKNLSLYQEAGVKVVYQGGKNTH